MTRVVPKLLLAAALVALSLPAAAAASPQQVIQDCTDDGTLSHTYSDRELRGALKDFPTDLAEYGDCRQIISGAIGAGAGKGGSGTSSGSNGSAGNSGILSGSEQSAQQSDRDALAALTANPENDPIEVGGEQVKPGENGVFDLASAENGVPTPLLLVLIAMATAAVAATLVLLRRRVPALSHISFPAKRISLPRGLGRPRFRR